ncbi:MAG: DMT family transporter [archaeon]|nr:DMT family transporter [archaeon]
MKSKITEPLILLPVIAGIMWGSSGTFVRTMSSAGLGRVEILSTRFFLAAIMLLIYILIRNRDLLVVSKKEIPYILGLGASVIGLNFFYNEAVADLSLSLAAVLLGMAPVFVIFSAAIIFKESITRRKILCIGGAILGCVLVSGMADHGIGSVSTIGIFMGIMAAFVYSFYSIFTKILLLKGRTSITVTFYGILVAAIVLIPLTDFASVGDYVTSDPLKNIVVVVAHAVMVAVLPYLFYGYALNKVEAGVASTIVAGMEPITATCCGLAFFGETPTFLILLGVALTIFALWKLCSSPSE